MKLITFIISEIPVILFFFIHWIRLRYGRSCLVMINIQSFRLFLERIHFLRSLFLTRAGAPLCSTTTAEVEKVPKMPNAQTRSRENAVRD